MILMITVMILVGYLLGAIPFGLLIAKIWKIDIRKYGSGNIGATNVFRTLGLVPGMITFALDFLKGMLAVYIGYWAGGNPFIVLLMGVSAIFGHMYSVFLGFKGGKGAATGLGVLAAFAPEIFIVTMILAAMLIYATRYVSVASIVSSFAAAIMMFILHKPLPFTIAAFLVALFILFRHVPNIKRLLKGEEQRI